MKLLMEEKYIRLMTRVVYLSNDPFILGKFYTGLSLFQEFTPNDPIFFENLNIIGALAFLTRFDNLW